MHLIVFILSLILFIIAWRLVASVQEVDDLSKIDDFEKELNKKTIIATIITIISVVILILLAVDSKTYELIEIEVPNTYSEGTHKIYQYETQIFKFRYENSWDLPVIWYVWILLFVESIFLITRINRVSSKKENLIKQIKRKEARKAHAEKLQRQAKEKEIQTMQFVTDNFGNPDKIIHTSSSVTSPDWSHTVFFVFDKELMCYNNTVVHFDELISCEYVDNGKIETKQLGTATTKSSTNTGSMLGRAVVGGVLAGGTGAIIGGATAKKTGETKIETNSVSITKHDYTIIINTTNVRYPLLKIPCGQNEQAVHEIVATLNAAIANNNNSII